MIVFTRHSLARYIEHGRIEGFKADIGLDILSPELSVKVLGDDKFIIARGDSEESRLVLIADDCWSFVERSTHEVTARFLERIDRGARAMARPPVSLPLPWSKFSYENLLSYFALPKNLNVKSLRWIAESLGDGHVCFWRLTDSDYRLPLQDFTADHAQSNLAISNYQSAFTESMQAFAKLQPRPMALQVSFDLERVGSGSLVKDLSYSQWISRLTDPQKLVLANAVAEPLKIRGVAGSGKTLTLELKALAEVYKKVDENTQAGLHGTQWLPRILYLTHSWSMAQQVEDSLNRLDERRLAAQVEVMPLTYLREYLQGDLPADFEVLGEDSLDGKQQQLRLISDAVDYVCNTSWETYPNPSDWVRSGVEGGQGDTARLRLCWALMREFIEVFDPHDIKPRINSLKKYLSLPRENWMVPLSTRADLELSFDIYSHYVQQLLVEEGLITTDQIVDDFRKYLETYIWNALRSSRGYDLVLVDEFHLFSDSERGLLHLLTRDAESHPRLIIAMDPNQSLFTLLTGLSDDEISRGSGSRLARAHNIEAIDLEVAHRFTVPIFNLVRYLHDAMPNVVQLGHDWVYENLCPSGQASEGSIPLVHFAPDRDVARFAAKAAFEALKTAAQEQRVALIGVGSGDLEAIKRSLSDYQYPPSSYSLIESRDDVERLRYSRRSLVVTASEYSAGLQFSDVIVVGGLGGSYEYGLGASAKRALYSQLYLAVSRAEELLSVYCPEDEEHLSSVLNNGIEAGVLQAEIGLA
ncbi:UvrD-helicase domain-containing protein [Streptomyces mirabilis]|uniref:UvrD-helicase domain-containing protein n=1 Tax=Streptomyces mirabilis TaxID=68239 RepID=UPI00369E8B34